MSAEAPAVENGKVAQWRSMDLTGKLVVITGGNEGIGKETSLDMARRRAKVIICCRNVSKGKTVAEEITRATGNQNVLVKPLDLCSFKSVRQLVDDLLSTEDKIDVLINNAGAFIDQRILTEDHVDTALSTNYLGHFLLTLLLLPLLKRSSHSRIVMLSSSLYLLGFIDFENLNAEKFYNSTMSYSNAKLAVMLFGCELAQRLQGTKVRVFLVDPGIVKTNLSVGALRGCFSLWERIPGLIVTAEQGARTSLYTATCEDIGDQSGKFYANCKERSVTPQACNKAVARKLWAISEKLCGTSYE